MSRKGSDCTRWPLSGLCSLTDLEATLAPASITPVRYPRAVQLLSRCPAGKMGDDRNQKQDQEDHKQYLGNPRSGNCNPSETKYSGDQCYYQEHQSPIKHDFLLRRMV